MMKSVAIGALLGLSAACLVGAPAQASEICTAYFFVGARGTGADWLPGEVGTGNLGMGPEAYELFSELTVWDGIDDQFEMSDGSTVTPIGLHYDASDEIVSSIWSQEPVDGYLASIQEGGEMLQDAVELTVLESVCPDSKFILAGYSQGADAIAQGIYNLTPTQRESIAMTVFWGDPQFNAQDQGANSGDFDSMHSGLFGTRPLWSSYLDSPVISECRSGDVVCNSTLLVDYHGVPTRSFDLSFINESRRDSNFTVMGHHEQYLPTHSPRAIAPGVERLLGITCFTPPPSTLKIYGPKLVKPFTPVRYHALERRAVECEEPSWAWYATSSQPTVSRSMIEEDPEEPHGVAPYFEREFEEPGSYLVSVTVETASGTLTTSMPVEVLPVQTELPYLPLLSRSETPEGDLLLSWTAGSDVPADFVAVIDPTGTVVDTVIPFREMGLDGVEYFEYVVEGLDSTESRDYTITAVNSVGETDSRMVLQATSVTYSHRVFSGAAPIGGDLTLTGETTPELDAAEADSLVAPIVPIDGAYEARLIAPGWEIGVDMDEVDAELMVDEGEWELEFEFGDNLDVDDYPIAQSMREGFADALLVEGLITIDIGGEGFVVAISHPTEDEQINKYVVNTNATVPLGIEIDEYAGSTPSEDVVLTHDGTYDTTLFPAWDESPDPAAYEWPYSAVSDVHVYIGNREVVYAGEVTIWALNGPTSEADSTVSFRMWGRVGDGSYLTMRSFLEDGAVSFRVDGGEPNVVALNATSTLAADLFPEPLPPEFLGDDEVVVDQGEEVLWSPAVDWSVWGGGPVQITADVLPSGMQVDWWGAISGVPGESGVYPFTVVAMNGTGSTVREYQLVVKSRDLPAVEAVYEHRIWPDGVAANGELVLTGLVNERLDGVITQNPGTPTLNGAYSAEFVPVVGGSMSYDMAAADVSFDSDGETWEVRFSFGDDVDSELTAVWERMRRGLAEELLAGGTIFAQVDGVPINFVINNVTETEENNRWVVDPSPVVPTGVDGDTYYGSLEYDTLEFIHNGTYDPLLFPASAASLDPLEATHWSGTDISDVHVYIGSQEVSFVGNVQVWAMSPGSVSDASIDVVLAGQIGDGSYLTDRAMLQDGTVSFRLEGGGVNVVSFDATSLEAESSFPVPTAPVFLDGTTIEFEQYEYRVWTPSISWGGVAPGTFAISTTDLSWGLYVDGAPNYANAVVAGEGMRRATYTVEVTATNKIGTTTQQFTIEVVPNTAKDHYHDAIGDLTRNSGGTLSLHMRNQYDAVYNDNATIQQWMPAVIEAGLGDPYQWGYEEFTATDVHLYLASGAEIPITGTFEVEIFTGSYIAVRSANMTLGDNTNTTVTNTWKQAVRLTFRRGTGEVNEFWKSARPWYSVS